MLMYINAEPGGRGINARLTQNRFHKRYSTVMKNNSRNYAYFEYYYVVKLCPQYFSTSCVEHTACYFFGPP